jgi:hypothetical protein
VGNHVSVSSRGRIVGYGCCGVLVALGALAAIFVNGTLGQDLAFILIAVGFVAATSLVFFEVGLSEDREREREERRRRTQSEPRRARARIRLGRERDHERRLR